MSLICNHPVFSRFPAASAYVTDFLDIKTRTCFFDTTDSILPQTITLLYPPPVNEEYFEWVDLLEAVTAADQSFTMIEIGAGYGRWLVRGAAALKKVKDIPYHLVGVEAEPQHFQWLLQHLVDNGIDPKSHTMINKAISCGDDEVWFSVGEANKHYGQSIVEKANYVNSDYPEQKAVKVPCTTLPTILSSYEVVDLLDMDIQGAEYQVVAVSIRELSEKVKRIHIGTHGKLIEDNLRSLFTSMGWIKVFDFSTASSSQTEFGPVTFCDGVQSWVNPRLQNNQSTTTAKYETLLNKKSSYNSLITSGKDELS